MRSNIFNLICVLLIPLIVVNGFSISSGRMVASPIGGINGGSSFLVSQRQYQMPSVKTVGRKKDNITMGGKKSKFGVASPIVYLGKIVLGTAKLNKVRAKLITTHSATIGDFCAWAGANHIRTDIIKKAKTNGDILGFLV
mmetsp:Transcript_27191/g.31036  ORF Transcript_27191/g.31036 Transcript_27191/m.31036 type:complete len:140 (-) Transcript_27191:354-773(-)